MRETDDTQRFPINIHAIRRDKAVRDAIREIAAEEIAGLNLIALQERVAEAEEALKRIKSAVTRQPGTFERVKKALHKFDPNPRSGRKGMQV